MEDAIKPPKKKKVKKDPAAIPKSFQALAKLTSSDIIQQVKLGMSKLAPPEPDGDGQELEEPTL